MNVILNEIKKEKKQTDNFRINLESDYIQFNLEAYQGIKAKDYYRAQECYENSVNVAKQLSDDYKLADSLTNLGITEFFNGKLDKSYESLQSALGISEQLPSEKANCILKLKILSNLCISSISLCKTKDSITHVTNILELIKNEKDISNQTEYYRSVINCFFRIDSLISFFEINKAYNINEKIVITSENRNNEEVHKQLIRNVMYNFHRLLRDADYDAWIKCLNEEKENFKYIHDYNGFLFATFNQYTTLYSKNPKNLKDAKDAKNKINSVKRILIGNISPDNDKEAEKILTESKLKIDTSIQIYRKLYEFESHLNTKIEKKETNVDSESYNSEKIFIKIFLRYALNYLNNEILGLDNQTQIKYMTQMKTQIEITMKLIDRDQVDLSKIKLFAIDPEITESLKRLFENILYIKFKNNLTGALKTWMRKVLGYTNKQEYRELKDKEFLRFMEKRYKLISQGDLLTKINFSSKGKKEHFYRLMPNDDKINVYENINCKVAYKAIFFTDVKKFCYGVSSSNLKKRFKNLSSNDLKSPWLFFSIVTKDRSHDLYLDESKLSTWFYGIKYQLKTNDMNYKLISVHNFVFTRLKLKLIFLMKEHYAEKKTEDAYKNIVKNLAKGNI